VEDGLWSLHRKGQLSKIEGVSSTAYIPKVFNTDRRALIATRNAAALNPYKSAGEAVWQLKRGAAKVELVNGFAPETLPISLTTLGSRTLIGTYGNGLWSLPDGADTAVQVQGPPVGSHVPHLSTHASRTIIATAHDGVWIIDEAQNRALEAAGDEVSGTLCIEHLGESTLIGTSVFGLWRLDDHSTECIRIGGVPADDVVRCILPSGKHALIGSSSGLYRYRAGADVAEKIGDMGVLSLAKIGSRTLIGTDGEGLWTLRDGARVADRIRAVPSGIQLKFNPAGRVVLAWGMRESVASLWVVDAEGTRAVPVSGVPEGALIWDILVLDGVAFIGTTHGLWKLEL
jgi:hypothetical protein